MICVQLNGGLGNQMFQYAFGKSLAYKHQTSLIFDTSPLKIKKSESGFTIRSLELNIFKININEADRNEIIKLKPLPYRIANVLSLKLGLQGIQTSKYFIENKFSFNSSIKKVGPNCFLSGYWQSFKYFQHIESIIREEFQFKPNLDTVNLERLIRIRNKNSISIHIRRNDFANNKYHDIHGTCSIEYYMRAIEFISDKVSSPFFFIFSDDIEWALTHFNLNYPCEFVSGNIGKKSYIDMQLMSQCKHNIIANSSFSWWGAWLNSNSKKIVIAPKKWYNNKTRNEMTIDLIPDSWLRL